MPIGEIIGCLFCIFALSFSTVVCIKLAIRFQDHIRIVRFIMFFVYVLLANQFGGSMLALAGAVRNQPAAEAQLGLNYLTGKLPGVFRAYNVNLFFPKNPERGRYWLDKASASGNGGAEAILAAAYLDGHSGLPKDSIEATKHLRKIADDPNSDKELRGESAIALAQLYEKGDGIPQNPNMAIKYKMVAADAGNGAAAYDLAQGFEKGLWTDIDYAKAYIYYKKAADNGAPGGMEGYLRLKEQLGQR
jgi:TPR repeat protein